MNIVGSWLKLREANNPSGSTVTAALLLFTLISLIPAAWNGYPLVFDDSNLFITNFRMSGFPPFYGEFVRLTSFGLSLFLPILCQAAVAAFTITIFLVFVGRQTTPAGVIGFGSVVLIANQLPWLTSWIMPDFLAGIGIAATLSLLAAERPAPWVHALVLVIIYAAVLGASANGPIILVVIATFVVLHLFGSGRVPAVRRTASLVAAVAAGFVTVVAFNLHAYGRAELNSATALLHFSRYADIGIAQPVVRRECAKHRYAICSYLDELDNHVRGEQNFLWGGLAEKTDARASRQAEYAELVAAIRADSKTQIILEGLRDTGSLFFRPTLENRWARELIPYAPAMLKSNYPAELPMFMRARQQTGELINRFPGRYYASSTYISYFVLVLMTVAAWIAADRRSAILGACVVAAIAAELLLHGLLVGPYPRYHVKVAWLGWLMSAGLVGRFSSQMVARFSEKTACRRDEAQARTGERLNGHIEEGAAK